MKTHYLRTLRIQRRYSQEDLERLTGIAQNTISKLENSPHVRPAFDTVLSLAKVLRVAPEQLRFGPDPKHTRLSRQKSQAVMP